MEKRAAEGKPIRFIDKKRIRASKASELYFRVKKDAEDRFEEQFKDRVPVMDPPDYDKPIEEQINHVFERIRSAKNTEIAEKTRIAYKNRIISFNQQFKDWISHNLTFNEFFLNHHFHSFYNFVKEFPAYKKTSIEYMDMMIDKLLERGVSEKQSLYAKLQKKDPIKNDSINMDTVKEKYYAFLTEKGRITYGYHTVPMYFFGLEPLFHDFVMKEFDKNELRLNIVKNVIEHMKSFLAILRERRNNLQALKEEKGTNKDFASIRTEFRAWHMEKEYPGYKYLVTKSNEVIDFLEYVSKYGNLASRGGNPLILAKAFEASIVKFLILGSPDIEVLRTTYKKYNDWLTKKDKNPYGTRKRWFGLDWTAYVKKRKELCEFVTNNENTKISKKECKLYDYETMTKGVKVIIERVLRPCLLKNDRFFWEILLILYLYTHQPPRRSSDYCNMLVVKNIDTQVLKARYQNNFYVHDTKTFVFNRYKTSLYSKSQIVQITDDVFKKYLDEFFKKFKFKNEETMFLPYDDAYHMINTMQYISRYFCIPFNVNSLRHFYATHISKLGPSRYAEHAYLMGTSSEMLSRHYIDGPETEYRLNVYPSRVRDDELDPEKNEVDNDNVVEEKEEEEEFV